jgi:hypothetical protein
MWAEIVVSVNLLLNFYKIQQLLFFLKHSRDAETHIHAHTLTSMNTRAQRYPWECKLYIFQVIGSTQQVDKMNYNDIIRK